ncbi:FG-GAP repeat protein [Rubinisphaera italica]|uniref:FG-GAP repeat protein n=2 Tax=Rubinisphaera italica TaxID=2527969 RepID=A0A5C5XEM7_9PLAN|nr:FG-GAP repeat protein [Rubinisphaera italica]
MTITLVTILLYSGHTRSLAFCLWTAQMRASFLPLVVSYQLLLIVGISVTLTSCSQPSPPISHNESADSSPQEFNVPIDESDLMSDAVPREEQPGDWFLDVTSETGINFHHHSGRESQQFTMVETFGSGIAVFDYDLDGLLDIYCVGGGAISSDLAISGIPGRLYRNMGNFRFEDVTAESGLDCTIDYSHGVAVGDVNSDHYPDLFVTCYGRSELFLNKQDGTFQKITEESRLNLDGWHTSAAFADLNQDGHLDLYVAGYLQWKPSRDELCIDPKSGLRDVCMPGIYPDAPDHLFFGQGDETFVEQSEIAGLRKDGKGLGVVIADFDRNHILDIYVANDVVRNHFYLGQKDGTWLDFAVPSGVIGNEFGAPEGSMGVHAADIDRDGWLDIVVTNYEFEENDLYHNEHNGMFTHMTVSLGLAGPCKPYVGFGTLLTDLDMDGWDDLVIVNGHVVYRNRAYSYQQPAFLYRNLEGKRFQDATSSAGPWFSVPHAGRGIAVGDLNNDGGPDLIVSEQDGPVSILKNLYKPQKWIGIQLIGDESRSDVTGATVVVEGVVPELSKTVISGGSYLSHSDNRLLFSLESLDVDRVDITLTWPDQTQERFPLLELKRYHQIKKGTGVNLIKNISAGDDSRARDF